MRNKYSCHIPENKQCPEDRSDGSCIECRWLMQDSNIITSNANGFSTDYPTHIDLMADCCGFFVPNKGSLVCNECGININDAIASLHNEINALKAENARLTDLLGYTGSAKEEINYLEAELELTRDEREIAIKIADRTIDKCGKLRATLDWMVHLIHGISKDGRSDISQAEWKDATQSAEQALEEIK